MKLLSACFSFDDSQVSFFGDEVIVSVDGTDVTYDNANRDYKPCVTHCKRLIDRVRRKEPKDGFEARRQKTTRTKLKVKK